VKVATTFMRKAGIPVSVRMAITGYETDELDALVGYMRRIFSRLLNNYRFFCGVATKVVTRSLKPNPRSL
jgi:hypothetical protein